MQFARFLLGPSFRHNEGRVDGRQIQMAVSGSIRYSRCVRSNISLLPAQPAFDFASVETQIAEHVVIYLGEFVHGAADSQFGLDRSLQFRQERDNSSDEAPPNKT